jgi:Prolyl oligopeptidase family
VDPSGLDPNNWSPIVNWFNLFSPGPQAYMPNVVKNLHCSTPSECNFTPDMNDALHCFQNCMGKQGERLIISGGRTKPNTWRDFIACGEYMIDHKYTPSAHLAGFGASAGGILIGRAIHRATGPLRRGD